MKSFIILAFILITQNLWAVCSSPISRTNNTPNAVLTSTKYNLDQNTVYARANNLPGDCIVDATISTTKLIDESVTAAKIASDVLARFIPSGAIIAFGGATAPSGFLLCNGQAVSRTTYADLFAAIGTAHGTGNGSTTFNVPDYRGRFLRGVDGGAGNDPDRASRTAMASGGSAGDLVGSVQADAFQNFTGSLSSADVGFQANLSASGVFGVFSSTTNQVDFRFGSGQGINIDASRVARTSTETRPKNANVHFIIKY
jgi:phage-related tail fiber protein